MKGKYGEIILLHLLYLKVLWLGLFRKSLVFKSKTSCGPEYMELSQNEKLGITFSQHLCGRVTQRTIIGMLKVWQRPAEWTNHREYRLYMAHSLAVHVLCGKQKECPLTDFWWGEDWYYGSQGQPIFWLPKFSSYSVQFNGALTPTLQCIQS